MSRRANTIHGSPAGSRGRGQIILAAGLALLLACSTEPDNKPPRPVLTVSPESGTVATDFEFDASASTDPDEEARFLQVRWDWNGDSVWDTMWGTVKVQVYRFDTAGAYAVAMEIKDSWGATALATVDVTVTDVPARSP